MNINYFGKVQLKIVSNGCILKKLDLHNAGTDKLFYKIATMLENSSSNTYGNLDHIDIKTSYQNGDSILNSISTITTSVAQNPSAVNILSNIYKDQLKSSYAVQDNYDLCLISESDEILAYVQIPKNQTIDLITDNASLIINWNLTFTNGESE